MRAVAYAHSEQRTALEQLLDFGLLVDQPDTSGTLQRVRHRDDRAGTRNGWYVLHVYTTRDHREVIAGAYGWWKAGDDSFRIQYDASGLDPEERKDIEAQRREMERQARQARAELAHETAARAQMIWGQLSTEGPSAYLATKRIPGLGVRFSRGTVVVPVWTGPEALVGLQFIQGDGTKRFLTGTAKKGGYCLLGSDPEPGGWLGVAEGYATAVSCHLAGGMPVACAFDAGNLAPVVQALKERYPGARFALFADDDWQTASNPGLAKAQAAAKQCQGRVLVPMFPEGVPRGTDWNDLHVAAGLEVAKGQVREALLAPEKPPLEEAEWRVPMERVAEMAGLVADATPQARPSLHVVGGTDHDPRPVLRITAGGLKADVDAMEARLLEAGAEIYQQGTRLVRIGQWAAEEDLQRGAGAAVLIDVSATWLRDYSSGLVRFERWDKREKKWLATNCPPEMAETLLARAGGWRFSTLVGFCDAPTITAAGRLVHAPGYDVASRLYLVHPPLIGDLGAVRPEEVAAASKYLFSLIDTFPFVSASDEAAALAMILTVLVRRVLPAAPIGCVSASTPGTGKSLLVNAIATLAVGRSAAVAAIGKDQEELEKRVDAVLLKGDSLCSFDNVDRAVKSDVLCQVTTESFKSVRILGLSRMIDAPTNVTWFMTGNNLTLLGDLVRRTLVCNLDAGMERPELRQFARNAIEHVRERRGQGIRAALTLIKGYLDAGCPPIVVDGKPLSTFGSFEVWDKLVRRPLMWAGWPDPLASAEGMREQDHEFGGMVDFLKALREASEGRAMTTAEILALMRERQGDYVEVPRWPDLFEAGETVFGPARDWDAQKLGYRLRPWKLRVLGGLRLVQDQAKGRRSGRFWRVEPAR